MQGLFANTDPVPVAPDASGAGVDGPFVFYRKGQILVKQINSVSEELIFTSKAYNDNMSVRLSCKSSMTSDQFSFDLVGKFDQEPDVYEQPDKMLVVSDIEGDFHAFKMVLFGAGVLDKDFNWVFGNGHVVLLGDFMGPWIRRKCSFVASLQNGSRSKSCRW